MVSVEVATKRIQVSVEEFLAAKKRLRRRIAFKRFLEAK